MTSSASSVFETTKPASADYLTRLAANDAGRDDKGRMHVVTWACSSSAETARIR
ncbi:hypothetical protein [Streptomyces hygroscopicus]|uniref:hypothetical protein n=1 Tax=Streptomyces hygroscopicus TaxID=1912 RepID=UPI000A6A4565|nr:hypothetical protein [Streptomyces hygroscopicus]